MYEPTDKDRRERRKNASVVRQQASDATKRCCERMIRCHGRSHPPSRYNVGEKVYVRLPGKDNLKNRKRQVFEAVIVNRNLNVHSYKANYISSVTGKRVTKWIPVDDIASLTQKEENESRDSPDYPEKENYLTRKNII